MEPSPASQFEHREIGLGTIPSLHEQEETFSPGGIHLRRENDRVGIQQNPDTKSNWAKMARSGIQVMQFIQEGRYIAVVAAGKVTMYGKRTA
jgi:hypothetical protein